MGLLHLLEYSNSNLSELLDNFHLGISTHSSPLTELTDRGIGIFSGLGL